MFKSQVTKTIKVTVDKGHILALGERMYIESIELIRELVNNAYDADATEVHVKIDTDKIEIIDNGSGMNEKGLTQFFTVGSAEKKINSVSPKFGRKRIGQFGIGKFAALAAADCFMVESQKGQIKYAVVFDRFEWQTNQAWELPIFQQPASPLEPDGTKVILAKLKRQFNLNEIERYLKDCLPLRAKKFTVFLNGKRLQAKFIPGRRYPFSIKTIYGLIDGEIVVAARSNLVEKSGVECRHKQVLICREFFGLDQEKYSGFSRITGEVNADFLTVLSSRSDFVRDSQEFVLFYQIMRTQLENVLKEIKKHSDTKHLKKINQELKEALSRIRQALEMHPELTPSGKAVAERRKRLNEISASVSKKERFDGNEENPDDFNQKEPDPKNQETKKDHLVNAKPEAIKRIRLPKLGVSVAIAALGIDGPEADSQGNLIYINSDHPLYQSFYTKKDQFSLHLLRLITQEIVLMKKLRITASEAFSWQSQLLTDAICK